MSLITRCPACQTMFKVVPDQLRISEGWVRCGKCEEIFDAAVHMQQAAPSEDSPSAGAPGSAAAAPFEGALAQALASDAGAGLAVSPAGKTPVADRAFDVEIPLSELHGTSAREPALSSTGPLPDGSAYGASGERTEPRFSEEAVPAAAPPSAAQLSFMRNRPQASRWHLPLVRATLLVTCLLLGLGLALQMLVHERNRVAVLEPGLRPLIEEVCLLLGCEIAPLRQIESVVIDSSAFSKIKGDLYRLSLTLKNNAPVDLAMPAVELALTDTLDHALMRRVLQPAELGVTSGVIPAASEAQATLVLTIKANGSGERVAGYRLLAFYP